MNDPTPAHLVGSDGQLAEIWGDVVSRPQLGKAILIGAAVSLAVYLIALAIIAPLASTPAIGKAIAMLAGILGCITGGAICARAFRPKRKVVEQVPAGAIWQTEILEQLEQEGGPMGRMEDLPPAVAAEMREVGLYSVFQDYEQHRARREERS